MNEKIVSEVLKRLDVLGATLSANGAKLGEEAIKYTLAYGMMSLVVEAIVIVAFPIIALFTIKFCKSRAYKALSEETEMPTTWLLVTTWTLLLIGLVLWVSCLSDIPTQVATIYAPGWAVVKSLKP